MRENASGAGNQQERPILQKEWESSETICRTPYQKRQVLQAYLFGAMHDGTIRHADHRFRIAQKGTQWLEVIQKLLADLHYNSWIYREGKTRQVYILESVAPIFRESFDPWKLATALEKQAYLRGFFDAEGGTPQAAKSKKYIQLVQKDKRKIELIKQLLAEIGIATGKIHNPSKAVDPNYWRIFVSLPFLQTFVLTVGSWHPRKRAIFNEWMKIWPMPYGDIGKNMNKASLGEPGDGSPPF